LTSSGTSFGFFNPITTAFSSAFSELDASMVITIRSPYGLDFGVEPVPIPYISYSVIFHLLFLFSYLSLLLDYNLKL